MNNSAINAIKESVKANDYQMSSIKRRGKLFFDQQWCEWDGINTKVISIRLGLSMSETGKALNRLHKDGAILKSKGNAGCWCRWWVNGLLTELMRLDLDQS